jgi:hypothetical protein
MEIQRFGVTTTVFVDAAHAGEAALIIERDFAGRFESEVVSSRRTPDQQSVRDAPHAVRSASSTTRTSWLVGTFGKFALMEPSCSTVSPIPMTMDCGLACGCGDCSTEWALPDQGVEFE